jgi:hypothetical protein
MLSLLLFSFIFVSSITNKEDKCYICNINCINNLKDNNYSNFFSSYYPGNPDNEACYIDLDQDQLKYCCRC